MKPLVPDSTHGFTPLRVVARGMCCSLGFNAAAATAAIQARMNHFRATRFVGEDGEPLVGAELHEVPVWGAERLALMVRSAAHQSLAGLAPDGPQALKSVAAMILCAEPQRPGMPREQWVEILQGLHEDWGLHPACSVQAYGKGGVAAMLLKAAALLNSPPGEAPNHVLLIGVDSLLEAAVIENLLSQGRVAGPAAEAGLIPGEGAAALLLTRSAATQPSLWIDAAAMTHDPWRWGADAPMRGQGLTEAVRAATAMAGTRLADLKFHVSGMNGEAWYARDMSLALSRCLEQRTAQFAHHMLAPFLGETGAAGPVLSLAWLAGVMGRPTGGPGRDGLLHMAGEDGLRSAVVLRWRDGASHSAPGALS